MNEDAELRRIPTEERRKHFAVEINPNLHPAVPGEAHVSVTHNGSHWTSIRLDREEAALMIETLKKYFGI